MRLTKDEFLGNHFTVSPQPMRTEASAEIAQQVDAFLRSGGQIRHVPIGASGINAPPKFVVKSDEQRERSKAAHAAKRTNGKLSLTAAARLAGMKLDEFRSLVMSGKGPKAFAQGHTYRFEEHEVHAWLQRREQIEADIVEAMAGLRRREA